MSAGVLKRAWRPTRTGLFATDLALVALAWWCAYLLRFNFDIPTDAEPVMLVGMLVVVLVHGAALLVRRVHGQVWRHTSMAELRQLAVAVAIAGLVVAVLALLARESGVARSVVVLHPILVLLMLGGVRAVSRSLGDGGARIRPGAQALLILGTLDEAQACLRALTHTTQWQPVGIVTSDARELRQTLHGLPVLGMVEGLADLASASDAAAAIVASPVGSAQRREALLAASSAGLAVFALPTTDELLSRGSASPRKVQLEDLLGRVPVALDERGLSDLFAGQCVMVTGGGGSIGSELCRQLARLGLAELVLVDCSELSLYAMEQELSRSHRQMKVAYYAANVREFPRLLSIAQTHRPVVVLHAAAYKHVPLMEERNEVEAARTNVMGSLHAARVAGLVGAQRFVMVSTDKAVNPTNVMGATKRLAERVVQSVARDFAATQFVSVRFGNVLGSSGSVVPLFAEQIERGGPVTITHAEIVRYFMTIPEASRLVLQAGLMGRSGQIYVLDMGEPVKIIDLARLMIRLSGKTEEEIPIAVTGLRPGEKLFEELLANDETTELTPHPKLRIARTNGHEDPVDLNVVAAWCEALLTEQRSDVRAALLQWVPEFASTHAAGAGQHKVLPA